MALRNLHSAILTLSAVLLAPVSDATSRNGFQLDGASVPVAEIRSGGPPRDGIPSIDEPKFLIATEANYLADDDRVLGVEIGGIARAYPIKILNWHEIVNDVISMQPFVVTYCPLCGSGMVFASAMESTRLIFGVSGLLYNSDMLLYDRNTESLWSQILAKAVSGKLQGMRLLQLPAVHTTWGNWRENHPASTVLSPDTGFRRDYDRSPYGDYEQSRRLYFSVSRKSPRTYHPKALVLGVERNGVFKAYPFDELNRLGVSSFDDLIGEQSVTVHWDTSSQSAFATDASGEVLPSTLLYWFAWYAFHPDTLVFKAP